MSWSAYAAYSRGDRKAAIDSVLGREKSEPTEAMLAGRELHHEFENETKKTGQIPKIFDYRIDDSLRAEVRHKAMVAHDIQITMFADAIGKEWIVDYKTGDGSVAEHSGSPQLHFYANFFPKITKGIYCHYNIYTGKPTVFLVKITEATKQDAMDRVINAGRKIQDHLEEKGLAWWR